MDGAGRIWYDIKIKRPPGTYSPENLKEVYYEKIETLPVPAPGSGHAGPEHPGVPAPLRKPTFAQGSVQADEPAIRAFMDRYA